MNKSKLLLSVSFLLSNLFSGSILCMKDSNDIMEDLVASANQDRKTSNRYYCVFPNCGKSCGYEEILIRHYERDHAEEYLTVGEDLADSLPEPGKPVSDNSCKDPKKLEMWTEIKALKSFDDPEQLKELEKMNCDNK